MHVAPDTYLFRSNDVSQELYVIASGTVELTNEDEEVLNQPATQPGRWS